MRPEEDKAKHQAVVSDSLGTRALRPQDPTVELAKPPRGMSSFSVESKLRLGGN